MWGNPSNHVSRGPRKKSCLSEDLISSFSEKRGKETTNRPTYSVQNAKGKGKKDREFKEIIFTLAGKEKKRTKKNSSGIEGKKEKKGLQSHLEKGHYKGKCYA